MAMAVAVLLAAGAITASSFILVNHRSHHQVAMKEVDVLGFARSFMTGFTSLDPFHANDYVDRLLAQATGDFAKRYREKVNEILINVAQAEPTKGTALDAGVERWNDDGSANVLVATEVTYKSRDGKKSTLPKPKSSSPNRKCPRMNPRSTRFQATTPATTKTTPTYGQGDRPAGAWASRLSSRPHCSSAARLSQRRWSSRIWSLAPP
jgi:Mce-associated membrane protein